MRKRFTKDSAGLLPKLWEFSKTGDRAIILLVIFATLFIFSQLILLFFITKKTERVFEKPSGNYFTEIEEIKAKNFGPYQFKEVSDYFKSITEKRGAEYAFELLKIAPMPIGIDMHLLGHIVGDELYKEQGFAGIEVCSDDFRNACSHSIVVGLFMDKGEEVLPRIFKACKKAPGGKSAYSMCFHGLGHGILAAVGYDMPKAVGICQRTGTYNNEGKESTDCIGGTVMEILGGGGHDRNLWEKQRVKYLKSDDPFYPCTAGFMPKETVFHCIIYQTPRLFELAGADLRLPNDQAFEKALNFCLDLPSPGQLRDGCYGGFGKEFVGLAMKKDVRKNVQITNEQYLQIYQWCLLAKDGLGINSCISYAVKSLYWGGENDKSLPIGFCKVISRLRFKSPCFNNLFVTVSYYDIDQKSRKEFCDAVDAEFRNACSVKLKI